MADGGRKPKPNALKILQGTDRPDRARVEVELPLPKSTAAPDWLCTPDAVKEWDKIVAMLTPAKLLSEGDLLLLGHLCNLHGKCVKLWRAGMDPKAADLNVLRIGLEAYGLTPASRSKAGPVPGSEGKSNPWAELAAGASR